MSKDEFNKLAPDSLLMTELQTEVKSFFRKEFNLDGIGTRHMETRGKLKSNGNVSFRTVIKTFATVILTELYYDNGVKIKLSFRQYRNDWWKLERNRLIFKHVINNLPNDVSKGNYYLNAFRNGDENNLLLLKDVFSYGLTKLFEEYKWQK